MTTTLTKPELSGRIKFGYWYNLLHARLYRRVDYVLTGLQLLMASYVINGLVKQSSEVDLYVSVVLAVVTVIQQLLSLQSHKAVHRMAASDYLQLERELDHIDCDQAASRLYDLYERYPDGLSSIEEIALGIVARMHAPDEPEKELSCFAKAINLIV